MITCKGVRGHERLYTWALAVRDFAEFADIRRLVELEMRPPHDRVRCPSENDRRGVESSGPAADALRHGRSDCVCFSCIFKSRVVAEKFAAVRHTVVDSDRFRAYRDGLQSVDGSCVLTLSGVVAHWQLMCRTKHGPIPSRWDETQRTKPCDVQHALRPSEHTQSPMIGT